MASEVKSQARTRIPKIGDELEYSRYGDNLHVNACWVSCVVVGRLFEGKRFVNFDVKLDAVELGLRYRRLAMTDFKTRWRWPEPKSKAA